MDRSSRTIHCNFLGAFYSWLDVILQLIRKKALNILMLTYTHLILVSELPLLNKNLKETCSFYKPHSISHPLTQQILPHQCDVPGLWQGRGATKGSLFSRVYTCEKWSAEDFPLTGTGMVCVQLYWSLTYWSTFMPLRKVPDRTNTRYPWKCHPSSLNILTPLLGCLESSCNSLKAWHK